MYKILLKFFEPAFLIKGKSFQVIFESFLSALWYDLIPLFAIPYLIYLVELGDKQKTLYFLMAISIVYLILWILCYFVRIFDLRARQYMEIAMNEKYRRKILMKNSLELEKMGTGKLQSIVQKGFLAWSDNVWYILYQVVRVVTGVAAGIYLTISMGKFYFIFFVFLSFLSGVGYTYFKLKQVKYGKKINDVEDDLNANYIRLLMSRQEVLFANNIAFEIKKIKEYINKIISLQPKYAKLDFISDLFISSLSIVIPITAAFYITLFDNTLSSGEFLSLVYFSARFTAIMYWYTWLMSQITGNYPELKKFWDFIENVPEITNYDTGDRFVHGGGEIILKNISFKYEDENILENFNLSIKNGERVALVGKSGSGKTTIAKLISGYIEPSKGNIFVDGQDLKKISLATYYKYIGYLTQESMVFDGSIKDNMIYALQENRKNVSDEEINSSLLKAGCDFVFKLKKGINTQIGERGVRLSGGERQRLAIAKLFLKNPEIIILDEPTSALDSVSEEKISKSLDELFNGRTTIIIAHRLQTVKKADKILVLDQGKIVEIGKHDELVEKNGVYAQMLNMQSGF